MPRKSRHERTKSSKGSRPRWKQVIFPAIILVLTVSAIGVWAFDLPGSSSGVKASGKIGTSVGDQVPTVSFTDLDGNQVAVPGDRPTLLYFMASWCASCAYEEDQIVSLQERYGDRLRIVSVDVDAMNDSPEMLRSFQKRYGGDWPHVLDKELVSTKKLGVRMLDTTLITNAEGLIVYKDERPTTSEELVDVVASLFSMGDA